MRRPPRFTLFPDTTLFRSRAAGGRPSPGPCAGAVHLRTHRQSQGGARSEEHTSELQSHVNLVCRLLLERCGGHRDLPSFPTRRSSDLAPPEGDLHPDLALVLSTSGSSGNPKAVRDRKSTRLNSSHMSISYAVFCLKDAAATEIYPLSRHDALPISRRRRATFTRTLRWCCPPPEAAAIPRRC